MWIENSAPAAGPEWTVNNMEGRRMNNDHCYECRGYGDDYRYNEDGELENSCDDCPFNEMEEEE